MQYRPGTCPESPRLVYPGQVCEAEGGVWSLRAGLSLVQRRGTCLGDDGGPVLVVGQAAHQRKGGVGGEHQVSAAVRGLRAAHQSVPAPLAGDPHAATCRLDASNGIIFEHHLFPYLPKWRLCWQQADGGGLDFSVGWRAQPAMLAPATVACRGGSAHCTSSRRLATADKWMAAQAGLK